MNEEQAKAKPTRYLLYSDHGIEYLARITIEAQVQVTWQYEANPPDIPDGPDGDGYEDMPAQGYVAVDDLCDPICDEAMADVVERCWLTPAEAAQVIQGCPLPQEEVKP